MLYTVREGDCLSSIAHKFGTAWHLIYEHPRNSMFREKRPDPNTICPGDVVFVPEPNLKATEIGTGGQHRFQTTEAYCKLRLRLVEWVWEGMMMQKPLAEIEFHIEIGGQSWRGRTEYDGIVDVRVAPTATRGRLTVYLPMNIRVVYPLDIGGLYPADSVQGVEQRLRNLGYLSWAGSDDDVAMDGAVKTFQGANGLPVTGTMGQDTTRMLVQKHGI